VARGHDVVAPVERRLVEEVPLRQPAGAARRTADGGGGRLDVEAVLGRDVDLDELEAPVGGEVAGVPAGCVGVIADAEAEIEAVGLVAEVHEQFPGAERVLPTRHGHQHPVTGRDHVEGVDGSPDLLLAVVDEAVGAEGGIVAPHIDERRGFAATTLHH
jgi:hypothetical protein